MARQFGCNACGRTGAPHEMVAVYPYDGTPPDAKDANWIMHKKCSEGYTGPPRFAKGGDNTPLYKSIPIDDIPGLVTEEHRADAKNDAHDAANAEDSWRYGSKRWFKD